MSIGNAFAGKEAGVDKVLDEMPEALVASGMRELVAEILLRYGSIEAFCARLHRLLDDPTDRIPPVTDMEFSQPGGRHRMRGL